MFLGSADGPFSDPEEWVLLREERQSKRPRRRPHGRWRVTCPECGKFSLTLGPHPTQPVGFHCHNDCSKDAILDADGLTWADVLYRTEIAQKRARSRANSQNTPTSLFVQQPLDIILGSFSLGGNKRWVGGRERTRMGSAKRLVLADLLGLVQQRHAADERRAVPYAQSWGGLRHDVDPSVIRRALIALERDGAITNVGKFQSPNPFRMMHQTKLWAVGVQPLPLGARDIERAPSVGGVLDSLVPRSDLAAATR